MPKVLSHSERNTLVFLLAVALISIILIPLSIYNGLTVEVAAHGGTYTEGMVGSPRHINPLLLQTNDVDSDIARVTYGSLMKYDAQGELIPDLAESYAVSASDLEYSFTIRENARWHDGSPVTADDVVFTVQTAQNADYESSQRINWQGVEVEKLDTLTVKFILKNPYAQFLNNTTLGILPKHIWEGVSATEFQLFQSNIQPIGSGPYRIAKIDRSNGNRIEKVTLVAFESYHFGKPFISKLEFKFYGDEKSIVDAYRSGAIDGSNIKLYENVASLERNDQLVSHKIKRPSYFSIFFNENHNDILEDEKVRKALNHATDRQAIIDEVILGNGTNGDSPLLPEIIGIPSVSISYPFDPSIANDLLDDAGWILPDGAKYRVKADDDDVEQELKISLTISNLQSLPDVAELIRDQWEVVGAKMEIITLSRSEIQNAIQDRDYDAIMFGEVLFLNPDPFSFWHSSQKRNPGLNLAMYDNSRADSILEGARRIMDKEERYSKYAQLQDIIIDDAPIIFLYSPHYIYLQTKNIRNFQTQVLSVPSDRFNSINEWFINTKRKRPDNDG